MNNHDGGKGPIDWDNEEDRKREGLNLNGAILNGIDLTRLALDKVCGSETSFSNLISI